MPAFQALLVSKGDAGLTAAWQQLTEADLMEGDVVVRVSHSTVNYKDGLAITGKLPVVRRWPMIPGIDFSGEVVTSTHAGFKPGDEVILNGWGVGETHFGAYAKMARVKGDWLIKQPPAILRRRSDGDRHGRLYGDALRDGAGASRRRARARTGARDGRRRRRRLRRDRLAGEARLPGDRLDRARARSTTT